MSSELAMTHARPLPPPAKGDRNPHEVSGGESRPAQTREDLTRGGGHRSGSRGAGTLEDATGTRAPHDGPKGPAAAGR